MVVVRDVETAACLVDEVSKLLGGFVLLLEVQLVFGQFLRLSDDPLHILIPTYSLRLMFFHVLLQISQTLVDKPKIVLTLIERRQRHDLHQRFLVVLQQNGLVLLPEEMCREGFGLEAVEELLHGFLEILGQSGLDGFVGQLRDCDVVEFLERREHILGEDAGHSRHDLTHARIYALIDLT